jgi:hypothetical protein
MKIFAADMWAIFNFDDPNLRYQKFLASGRPSFKGFLENILLYDEIIVPTQDFLSLTILVGVLGEKAVIELLEAGRLKFLRVKGSLGYIGNGGGLQAFEMQEKDEQPISLNCPLETAITWAIKGLDQKVNDSSLTKLALFNSTEISIKSLSEDIRKETYADILKSIYLPNNFSISGHNLNRLPGIGPKGVQIFGGRNSSWKGNQIDVLLALATTNLELKLIQIINADDASTSSPIGHIFKAKANRLFGNNSSVSLSKLFDITGIPDIGELILNKEFSLTDLLKLTTSANGIEFRQWFHENCRSDPNSIVREYIKLLKSVPGIQSVTSRIIRFVVTSAIGFVPVIGQVASAIDAFFVDKLIKGTSAKYFIQDLEQLTKNSTKDI